MKPTRLLLLIFAWVATVSCDPLRTDIASSGWERYTAQHIDTADTGDSLRVMTWNIQHGGGGRYYFYHCTSQEALATEQRVRSNLRKITAAVDSLGPDILFLQRADIKAKRSTYINQVQYILDSTRLNYAVYTPMLQSDFLPYYGLGPVNSGVAILSRGQLNNPSRLPLTDHQPAERLPEYFKHQRALLQVALEHKGQSIQLIDVSLSPYLHNNTKAVQLEETLQYMQQVEKPVIAAGTWHAVPSGAPKLKDFDDEPCPQGSDFFVSDYTGEAELMADFYRDFKPAITASAPVNASDPVYTYTRGTSALFTRKVDYIFSAMQPLPGTARTMQAPGPASNHAPVVAIYLLE